MAGELEHPRERVPVGGVPPAGGGQRAGRVGADELHQDRLPLPFRNGATPESVALPANRGERGPEPAVGQEHVYEARAGDLHPLHQVAQPELDLVSEPPRHLARRRLHRGGKQQRQVGRVVAELRPRRPLDHRLQLSVGIAQGGRRARQLGPQAPDGIAVRTGGLRPGRAHLPAAGGFTAAPEVTAALRRWSADSCRPSCAVRARLAIARPLAL